MATKIDDGGAAAFLTTRFPGCSVLRPLRQGVWSRALAFDDGDGRPLVARFGSHREDFEKDRLAADYASRDLPIPRMVEMGEALGGWYAITERATGGYIEDLDEAGMRRLLPSLLRALDAARSVRLPEGAGFGGWNGAGRAPHRTWRAALLDVARDRATRLGPSWRAALAATSVGTGPFDDGLRLLRQLIEICPNQPYLVHGDLLHFNVLVADDRVAAVLDWGSSIHGDFIYDIAWIVFWQPRYPQWSRIDFVAEAAGHYRAIGLEVPHFIERLRCYELHIALDSQGWYAQTGETEHLERTARRIGELVRSG